MAGTSQPFPVFVCYAHTDNEHADPRRRYLDLLLQHLGARRHRGSVQAWSDKDVASGTLWDDEIRDALERARAVIILVSSALLNSEYIGDSEMPEILWKRQNEGAVVIPIILRHCDLDGTVFRYPDPVEGPHGILLSAVQAVNDPGRPLDGLPESERDEVFAAVSRLLRRLADPASAADAAVGPAGRHNLPYNSLDRLLKGRGRALNRLRKRLAGGKKAAITQLRAIHGLGGVGKTRLAVEYGHRGMRDGWYRLVLFVGADTPELLRSNLAALAGPRLLDLGLPAELDQPATITHVLRALAEWNGWLLIFDNVDSEESQAAVLEYAPLLDRGHVLITSRRSEWPASIPDTALDKLSEADSAKYLLDATATRRVKTKEDRDLAREIGRELDGLPVALAQAAAYVNYRRIGFAAYLREFRDANARVGIPARRSDVDDYPHAVLAAWETTVRRLGLMERALLRLASLLAPVAIPTGLFEDQPDSVCDIADTIPDEPKADLPDSSGAPPDVRGALANLGAWSMVTLQGASFSVHRLVQEATRLRIPEDRFTDWTRVALDIVSSVVPRDAPPEDVRSWPFWNAMAPHVQTVADRGDARGIPEPTGKLMNELGLHLKARCEFAAAETVCRRSLGIAESSFGSEHAKTAVRLESLAALLHDVGRHEEAEPLYRRSLAISEAAHRADHPDMVSSLNGLARLVQDTNRFAEAEALYRRAVVISEAAHGPDHPDVASSLNGLAILLHYTNRHAEAEPLYRRAQAICRSAYGSDHPEVANPLHGLATLLQDTNRLAEAEPLFRRALAIDEASYGPDHPEVAMNLYGLARLLQSRDRFAESEPLFRRALAIDEASYGPDHPEVATDLCGLANLLRDTGRHTEAEPLYRRALAIDETSYGPDHPDVAIRLSNLARLLHDTNRLAEGEPLYRRALAIDEASYGPEHPRVATDLHGLAKLLQATSRVAEAEPLFRRALAIDEASYGPDHPDVARDLGGLALLLQETNRLREGEPLLRRAVDIYERGLGPDHPRTRNARENLEILLEELNSRGQGAANGDG